MPHPQQLLSYIAHVPHVKAAHIEYRNDLTDRGFPCVISNDLNSGKEYPNCDRQQATEIMLNRIATLKNENNKFFIYFIDESSNDNVGNFELGVAFSFQHVEYIIFIGLTNKTMLQFIKDKKVKWYPNWIGFITNHFFTV